MHHKQPIADVTLEHSCPIRIHETSLHMDNDEFIYQLRGTFRLTATLTVDEPVSQRFLYIRMYDGEDRLCDFYQFPFTQMQPPHPIAFDSGTLPLHSSPKELVLSFHEKPLPLPLPEILMRSDILENPNPPDLTGTAISSTTFFEDDNTDECFVIITDAAVHEPDPVKIAPGKMTPYLHMVVEGGYDYTTENTDPYDHPAVDAMIFDILDRFIGEGYQGMEPFSENTHPLLRNDSVEIACRLDPLYPPKNLRVAMPLIGDICHMDKYLP